MWIKGWMDDKCITKVICAECKIGHNVSKMCYDHLGLATT